MHLNIDLQTLTKNKRQIEKNGFILYFLTLKILSHLF